MTYILECKFNTRSRRATDRTLPCEGRNLGSIPNGGTRRNKSRLFWIFSYVCQTERCEHSSANRESGSRNFASDGEQNIRDHKLITNNFLRYIFLAKT